MKLPAILLLSLAACAYQPPPRTDIANPAYVAARDTCQEDAAASVNKTNAKTGLAWFASPVRRWSQIADATGACMADQGFGRLRWCTPEELSGGHRRGDMIVTASGIQCADPAVRR